MKYVIQLADGRSLEFQNLEWEMVVEREGEIDMRAPRGSLILLWQGEPVAVFQPSYWRSIERKDLVHEVGVEGL